MNPYKRELYAAFTAIMVVFAMLAVVALVFAGYGISFIMKILGI